MPSGQDKHEVDAALDHKPSEQLTQLTLVILEKVPGEQFSQMENPSLLKVPLWHISQLLE